MSGKKEVEVNLREAMHKKIVHAKQRGHLNEQEIYALSREFFRKLLKLDYEFTHEELIEELKKTYLEKKDYEQVIAFIQKIGVIEFTTADYPQDELKNMISEFEDITIRLTQETKKKGSWLSRVFRKKEHKQKKKDLRTPNLENLIHQIKQAKKNKQELYHEAISAYEALPEEKKALYYTDLLGIYYDLKQVKATKVTKKEMKEFEEGLHLQEKKVIKPENEASSEIQKIATVALDLGKKENQEKTIEQEQNNEEHTEEKPSQSSFLEETPKDEEETNKEEQETTPKENEDELQPIEVPDSITNLSLNTAENFNQQQDQTPKDKEENSTEEQEIQKQENDEESSQGIDTTSNSPTTDEQSSTEDFSEESTNSSEDHTTEEKEQFFEDNSNKESETDEEQEPDELVEQETTLEKTTLNLEEEDKASPNQEEKSSFTEEPIETKEVEDETSDADTTETTNTNEELDDSEEKTTANTEEKNAEQTKKKPITIIDFPK